jgi:methylglutaconyl-CoA hydratase
VATADLDAAVNRQADLLRKAGPVAAATAKALVMRIAANADSSAVDAANADLIAHLRVSPEGQEGIAAFLEKRRPSWCS